MLSLGWVLKNVKLKWYFLIEAFMTRLLIRGVLLALMAALA